MMIAKGAINAYLSRDFDSFVWMKKLLREELSGSRWMARRGERCWTLAASAVGE